MMRKRSSEWGAVSNAKVAFVLPRGFLLMLYFICCCFVYVLIVVAFILAFASVRIVDTSGLRERKYNQLLWVIIIIRRTCTTPSFLREKKQLIL